MEKGELGMEKGEKMSWNREGRAGKREDGGEWRREIGNREDGWE